MQDSFEYIEVFCNRLRSHSTLRCYSPAEFEAGQLWFNLVSTELGEAVSLTPLQGRPSLARHQPRP